MQTSAHLRLDCSLRAISPGPSPGRWRTPSMRVAASIWEALSALPNPPGPTLAVGSPAVPQPGARGVALRWRWSRLPGPAAERVPRCLRASMGPVLRQRRVVVCVASSCRAAAPLCRQTRGTDRLRDSPPAGSMTARIAGAVVGACLTAGDARGDVTFPLRSVLQSSQGRPASPASASPLPAFRAAGTARRVSALPLHPAAASSRRGLLLRHCGISRRTVPRDATAENCLPPGALSWLAPSRPRIPAGLAGRVWQPLRMPAASRACSCGSAQPASREAEPATASPPRCLFRKR